MAVDTSLPIESSAGALWVGGQTDKGTPATEMDLLLRWRSGDISVNPQDASEDYMDGFRWADSFQYRTGVTSGGTPLIQATPRALAYFLEKFLGAATVSTTSAPVPASLTTALTGSDNDVIFTAKSPGTGGNAITVAYVVSGNSTPFSVSVTGSAITVNVQTDSGGVAASPAVQVLRGINNNAAAAALVAATLPRGTDGYGIVTALAATNLAGGAAGAALSPGRYRHTSTDSQTGQGWKTYVYRIGDGVGTTHRWELSDSKTSELRVEMSAGSRVVHITDTFTSLRPRFLTADPAAPVFLNDNLEDPYLYSDVHGTITVDGDTVAEINQLVVVFTHNLQPWYADDINPLHLISGRIRGEISGNMLVTDQTVDIFHHYMFGKGTADLVDGDAPQAKIHRCAISFSISRGTGPSLESTTFVCPKVYLRFDNALSTGSTDGAPLEMAFAGALGRDASTNRVVTVHSITGDSLAY